MKRKGLAKDGKIRRRIKAINYTRDIALPKDWVRSRGLDAGDEVEIEAMVNGDLRLRARARTERGAGIEGGFEEEK
jgi:phosphate uptake regulator